jgi:hypothetical protein
MSGVGMGPALTLLFSDNKEKNAGACEIDLDAAPCASIVENDQSEKSLAHERSHYTTALRAMTSR